MSFPEQKAHLVQDIVKLIKAKNLTQRDAAKLIGVSQPDVSKMFRGSFKSISFDRIFKILRILGCTITVEVSK